MPATETLSDEAKAGPRGTTVRLFGTSTFQIALLYLALFSATVLGVLGFIYWSTSDLIDQQMSKTIQAEVRGLSEQYRAEGLLRLVAVIRERSGPSGSPENVYLLADPHGRPLAGNLARWPDTEPDPEGWLEVPLRRNDDPEGTPHTIRARLFTLPDGFRLLVGRDTEERGDFRSIMAEGLAWAFVPILLIGLLGGVLIGRYSLRRVDAVRAASQDIIKGDLTRRVPLSGSGDEFDRLAQTINEMLDRIDTLMTGMRVVTDSLAHDLRSPLTRAKSGIELALRRESDAGAYREALEQTSAELDTILRTFVALIDIAAAEAGMDRLSFEPVDLSGVVGDLCEMYQPIAEDAGLAFDAEIAGDLRVSGHRQLLAQAVANLLDNAVKFTPSGGRISVSLTGDGDRHRLTVDDTGPGVPVEHRGRVLQRFVRLDSSRSAPGSGLGLSLVAAVARLHGANLTLGDNSPGLRVAVEFPRHQAIGAPEISTTP